MPQSETRICQNCKASFFIDASDFAFYGKIKVPPPTFCPQCRLQRRMTFINFIHLHRRKCDLCGKETVSKYAQDAPFVVYCVKCYYSDHWDPMEYGQEYDFSRPFFDQLRDLFHKVPIIALDIDPIAAEYSPFSNHAGDVKNCYLVFFAGWSEDCLYGFNIGECRSLVDCSLGTKCDFCYDSVNIFKNNRCIGVQNVTESVDCAFLRDSSNCQHCFASANLRNKKYYVFNQPYTKEAYFEEIKKWDLGSYAAYREVKARAEDHWKKFPPRPLWNDFSTNSTGNYVFESKNCTECYEVIGAEDSKYLMMMVRGPVRECYDITGWGDNLALSYEGYVGTNVSGAKFCMETNVGNMVNGEYFILASSQDIFGCVSVKQKKYCILNKQYTKDEYFKLRERIVAHMNEMPYVDKRGRVYRYGEFFPAEMSWSPYNETVANVFFPMDKKHALAEGYGWRGAQPTEQQASMRSADLPDHVKEADDHILQETIACSQCPRAYRIISSELRFLRAMNLPLPRVCPLCRIDGRIKRWAKNLDLTDRTCAKCGVKFKTPYREADAPLIWCPPCYNAEVV